MSEPIERYTDLKTWQKAFNLGIKVHSLVGTLPEFERYGLTAQLRRVAVEASTWISHGFGTGNTNDYLWHLKNARGDLNKMDTLLFFAREFKYLPQETLDPIKAELEEAEKVLAGLIRSLGG